jgi:hypothetical protein
MLFLGDPLCACIFHPLAWHLARANKPNLTTTTLFDTGSTSDCKSGAQTVRYQPNQLPFFFKKLDQAREDNQAIAHGNVVMKAKAEGA